MTTRTGQPLPSFPRPRPAVERLERRRLFAAYRLIDLGTLGGAESFAYDVNDAGQVVGYAQTASGQDRAFRFTDLNGDGLVNPGEMLDLGALSGHAASYAYGINESGLAVGTSRSAPYPADGVERA